VIALAGYFALRVTVPTFPGVIKVVVTILPGLVLAPARLSCTLSQSHSLFPVVTNLLVHKLYIRSKVKYIVAHLNFRNRRRCSDDCYSGNLLSVGCRVHRYLYWRASVSTTPLLRKWSQSDKTGNTPRAVPCEFFGFSVFLYLLMAKGIWNERILGVKYDTFK
jgi:hypothetical protein